MKKFVLAAVLGLSSCAVKPPPPNFAGRRIASLSIRYAGRPTVDEARLKNLISSKAGTRYSNDHLDADVKSLYESGLVDDVRFTAEPEGEAVRVIAEVSTRPPLGPPFAVGNTVFSDQKLAKVSKLNADQPTAKQMEAARQSIERYYRRYGYKDVKVAVAFPWRHTESDNRQWVFDITEGEKAIEPKSNRSMRKNRPG